MNGNTFHVHGWEHLTFLSKMALLPKLIYRVSAISTEIPASYFAESDKLILTFIWKWRGTQNWQNNLEKKNVGGQTFCKTTVIKTVVLA